MSSRLLAGATPCDVKVGPVPTTLPCQFCDKKTKWLLKTKQISKLMAKEATKLLLVVAASSAGATQRWDCLVLPRDANTGGVRTILPCQLHWKEKRTFLRKPTKSRIDKILKSVTKVATTFPLAIAASSVELTERWNHLVLL